MKMKRWIGLGLVVLLLSATSALALPDKPWKEWFPYVNGGWVGATGTAGDFVDDGWGLGGGVIYLPAEWPVGILIDAGWSSFDLDRSALQEIDIDNGDVTIWNLSGGGIWSTRSKGKINFSVAASLGWYRSTVELKNPGVGWVPPSCSPGYWWWWCSPGGPVSGQFIEFSDTQNSLGYSLGLGLSFTLGNDSEIFLDLRYQRMDTDPEATEWFPVYIGYRW